jgi:hypothetical protein
MSAVVQSVMLISPALDSFADVSHATVNVHLVQVCKR